MTITYHAGRRIQGLDADRTATQLPSGSVGGWVELGRTTLGGTGSTIDVSSISDKRYYMVLTNIIMNSSGGGGFRVGNSSIDTGTNYANRFSINGGADATGTSYTLVEDSPTTFGGNQNNVMYIANYSSKEKLFINHQARNNTAGATNAPTRFESVAKWTNTSNPIDIMRYYAQAGNFASGSEVVVLGWDPADSHTNNFWEELGTGSGTGTSLSVTFTAKKYLWVQCFFSAGASSNVNYVFNDDTTGTYAQRENANGGTDGTQTQITNTDNLTNSGTGTFFTNMFILNNASNEKLWINHGMQATAGATNAPTRRETVGKWVNTSNQITKITSTFGSSSTATMKVWGAD